MSTLSVSPDTLVMSTADELPLGFDFSQVTSSAVTNPGAKLIDETVGSTVTLVDAASAAGTVVTQIVRGSALIAGHSYTLLVWATISSNNVQAGKLSITCDV